MDLLAADVELIGDAGGKAPHWGRAIVGVNKAARLLAATLPPLAGIGVVIEPCVVNGQPGAILRDRDGRVINTLMLEFLGGRIQTIRSVLNPDKLGHLGPVADAWSLAREVTRERPSR